MKILDPKLMEKLRGGFDLEDYADGGPSNDHTTQDGGGSSGT